ncbi:MAG: hypothetical protein HOP28_12960 [Gemmatimonadales bacterium]|nr:hypothetical protein [Gemmatimonadales bacterium]
MLRTRPDLRMRFDPPDEKAVQATLVRLFTVVGFRVGSTSQYRRSGQVVGLPDLLLRPSEALRARRFLRFAWWETKAPLARWRDRDDQPWTYYNPLDRRTWRSKPLQPAQMTFREDALACDELHGWGGLAEAEVWLVNLALGVRLPNGVFMADFRGAFA